MPGPVMKEGVICHVEIPTADAKKAQEFYGNVFGWTFQHMPEMNYTLFQTAEGGIGGGFFTPEEGMPKVVVNYILVGEIEPMVAKAQAAGATLVKDKTEVPHAGWFALLSDPDGNLFGIWKSAHPLPPPEKAKKKPARKAARKAAKPAAKKAAPAAAKKAAKPARKAAKAAKPAKAAKSAKKAARPAKKAAKPAKKKGRR